MHNVPLVGISLMPQTFFLEGISSLLLDGSIEMVEWNFDIGWGPSPLPKPVKKILDHYEKYNRLIGHGVEFSLLSADWTPAHETWLKNLRHEVATRQYRHISEHFGFMTAGNFHQGAPLPIPLNSETLALGRERLQTLHDIIQLPVGLENLALAFGPRDVEEQGEFLEKLLAPLDGFLLLDLHNLYCQMHNFSIPAQALLDSYPLERVREIHVSGGSWYSSLARPGQSIRRDTHDDRVPNEVFELLELTLPQCPHLEFVVLERMGHTLDSDEEVVQFRKDYQDLMHQVKRSYCVAGS